MSGLVYFLFLKKTNQDPKLSSYDSRSEVYWQRLQNRPEVLFGPSYPKDLRDFLETLRGKESYLWKGDRDKTYEYLLETYPDERAHVLYALYVAFMNWKEKSFEVEQREDLSSYEKLTAVNRLSEQIFPDMIRNLIFPKHPTNPPVFLLSYLEDYVQKNPYSYSRERKRIFLKKKKELYQNEKWEIQSWESPTFLRQVIELIYSREILEMSEEEKTSYRNAKLEELKADFWN